MVEDNNKNFVHDKKVRLPGALIKFGKKKHMESMFFDGEIRFSVSNTFKNEEKNDNINDAYEGHLFYDVRNLIIAPLLDPEKNIYGAPIKLSEKAKVRITNETIQGIPFACFYGYERRAMNCVVKIDNYEEIITSNNGYDTAVIIYNPLKFLEFIENKESIYFNNVIYTDKTPIENEIKNQLHCIFYKRKKYESQQEFRIALQNKNVKEPFNESFGALDEFAYIVPIEMLKRGFVICDSSESAEIYKREIEGKNNIKLGKFQPFDELLNGK